MPSGRGRQQALPAENLISRTDRQKTRTVARTRQPEPGSTRHAQPQQHPQYRAKRTNQPRTGPPGRRLGRAPLAPNKQPTMMLSIKLASLADGAAGAGLRSAVCERPQRYAAR